MSRREQECPSIGTVTQLEGTAFPEAAKRFRAYRLAAENKERKFKESELIIDRLKGEIDFSREAEKNLRNQICSAQDRLLGLQSTLKNFLTVSERQRQNQQFCQKIEQTLQELSEKINQTRKASTNLLKCTSREADLLKKIKELELVLAERNNENDLMKMEIQAQIKEKELMEAQFQQTLENLRREVEKLEKKEAEAEVRCREIQLYYKRQIQDYEQRITCYEAERRSYMEDFEPPKVPEKICNTFAWADSTVTINVEEKPKTKMGKGVVDSDENDLHQQFRTEGKPSTSRKGKGESFSRMPVKQKLQLHFLTSQDSSRGSVDNGRKRRLFSTNCNHYID